MAVLIAGDSRAVNLSGLVQTALDDNNTYEISECAKHSRNISDIQTHVLRKLRHNAYDAVIFLAGTCDLTNKRYINGKRDIFYPHPDAASCRAVVSVRLSELVRACSDLFPETKFVLCTLYGLSLEIFNNKSFEDPMQKVLNKSIKLLKNDIKYINTINGVPNINLHTVFHRNRYNKSKSGKRTSAPSRFVCQYKNKMRDGCHPTTTFQEVIAKRIADVIKIMYPPNSEEEQMEMSQPLDEDEVEDDDDTPEWDEVIARINDICLNKDLH